MSQIKQAFWRIGSADAVTWLSFWLTFTGAIIASFVSTSGGISWAFRLGVVGAGQLILWAPLALSRWLVLRMNADQRTAIALIVIGAFCVGATMRTLFIGFAFIWAVGPEAALWPTRIFGSFGTIGLVFAVTAYAVSSAREQRRRIEALEEVQADLEQSVVSVRTGIEERGEQSVQRVRGILESELAALHHGDAGGAVESLERMARDVVRPLSHELAETPVTEPATDLRSRDAVSWVKVLDLAARGKPFKPLATGLLVIILVLGAIGAYPPAAARFMALPVAAYATLAVANLVDVRLFGQRPLRVRLAILLLSALACGMVMALVGYVLMIGQPVQRGTVLGCLFFTVVFALGVTANSALNADRRLTIAQLDAAATQLRRNLALVNQVRWFQEKALSRALHGPVQTAITAAALRLDAAMRAGSVPSELVDQVRVDIARDLDVLGDATRNAAPLDDGIASIVSTWEGVCDIAVDVEPAAAVAVAADAPLRACAVGIATEAISNAVRHGKSTTADLRIVLGPAQDAVVIEVDSRAPVDADRPMGGAVGLGTRQLDECTTSWALTVGPRGQHLRAVLPSRSAPRGSGLPGPSLAHAPLLGDIPQNQEGAGIPQ